MRDIYAIARAVRQSHICTCVVVLAARRSRLHHLSPRTHPPPKDENFKTYQPHPIGQLPDGHFKEDQGPRVYFKPGVLPLVRWCSLAGLYPLPQRGTVSIPGLEALVGRGSHPSLVRALATFCIFHAQRFVFSTGVFWSPYELTLDRLYPTPQRGTVSNPGLEARAGRGNHPSLTSPQSYSSLQFTRKSVVGRFPRA